MDEIKYLDCRRRSGNFSHVLGLDFAITFLLAVFFFFNRCLSMAPPVLFFFVSNFPLIANVRYIKILKWLRGFLLIFLNLVWLSFCPSLFWELRENGVVNNLQFCPQRLGVRAIASLPRLPRPSRSIHFGDASETTLDQTTWPETHIESW